MIGGGLTEFEADVRLTPLFCVAHNTLPAQSMTRKFRRELELFDLERALPAWDGLVSKQQAALEALGVPTMFPSAIAEDRKVRDRL